MLNLINKFFSEINDSIQKKRVEEQKNRFAKLLENMKGLQEVEQRIKEAEERKASIVKNLGKNLQAWVKFAEVPTDKTKETALK
jgi:hypothetical protein